MRVIITGGAGFIGSRLVKRIIETKEWEVLCLDNLNYSGNLNRIKMMVPESKRLKVIHHDLRAELNGTTRKMLGAIDCVFHLAAKPHVDQSIKDPLSTVMHNVVGTCNVLNYARESGIGEFIFFSTDEVFGEAAEGQSFNEYSRYNSRNPYSASKAGAEELVSSFFHTYGLKSKVIHCNNVYGESQQAAAFIPLCISKLSRGEEITIHSDETGTQVPKRKYIYVEDVVDGIMTIKERGANEDFHEGNRTVPKYNIISNEEVSILELSKMIASCMGAELKYSLCPTTRTGVDKRYSISGEKIMSLGWRQTSRMEKILPNVVRWFVDNPDWLQKN